MYSRPEETNVKTHAHGVITYTLETTFLPGMDHGWGNGYICIPVDHPFMKNIKEDIHPLWTKEALIQMGQKPDSDSRMINSTYNEMNIDFPIEEQEWTYSSPETRGDKKYYTFGFDTAHYQQNMQNWPQYRVVGCIENFVNVVNACYNYSDAERERLSQQIEDLRNNP